MFKGTITAKQIRRLLPMILGLFLFFSSVAAAVLYYSLQVPLSPHYGAAITVITQVKESLVQDTVIINLVFFLATAAGVVLLGILYSHRIAGPLFKVKQHAAALGEGRFDGRIRFRQKDAVHSLASVLNEMAAACRDRTRRFSSDLEALEEKLRLLDSLPQGSKDQSEMMERIRTLDAEIQAENRKLKL